MKTVAIFFPFDLFGSGGTGNGATLLADAFAEMLSDNKRERVPTRAQSYAGKVHSRQIELPNLTDYQSWRPRARRAIHRVLQHDASLLWVTGNHLGVLPLFDELALQAQDTVVVQFDAHLDIYNLSDSTTDLSHGNYLLHCAGPLPRLVNVGHRELLLHPEYVSRYFQATFPATALAVDPEPALQQVEKLCQSAGQVVLDIDCDVFDPAYFPASTHPLPFGLTPHLFLRFLNAAWSGGVRGIALSEFDPARDRHDQALSTLIWLLEYVLLRWHEQA